MEARLDKLSVQQDQFIQAEQVAFAPQLIQLHSQDQGHSQATSVAVQVEQRLVGVEESTSQLSAQQLQARTAT